MKIALFLICMFLLSACSSMEAPATPPREGLVVPLAWQYGPPAPPWSGTTATRSRLSSSDFNNHVVVLSFWATWCLPCLEELPALERLQRTLGQQGISVVTVMTDEDLFAADQLWRRQGLSLPIVLDADGQIAKTFGVASVPQTFVIGPGGRFVELQDAMTGRFDTRFGGMRPWDDSRHMKLCRDISRAARR